MSMTVQQEAPQAAAPIVMNWYVYGAHDAEALATEAAQKLELKLNMR